MLISIVFAAPKTTDSAIQEDNAVESIPDSENNEISTPLESENINSDNEDAVHVSLPKLISVPAPAGITAPDSENPRTVVALAEIKNPTPDMKPDDVVRIQLKSLMKNNEPYLNAGIEQTWEFAHPSNRAFTGPIQRFTQMMYAPSYSVMINHIKHDIFEVKLNENSAYFFIELTSDDGKMFGFKWTLQKVLEEGIFKNCWMTTSVSTPMPLSTSS